MLEQRPTAVAPLLLTLGAACALGAGWLPLSPNSGMALTALGAVGAVLAAGPAWRWWARTLQSLR
ncbi:MAG: hypothetical protein JHC82_11935 [Stenotrophomonas sp.]|jgi:hypothetical protein|nr:hypothetical protein [Stenotrophomonas sp.]